MPRKFAFVISLLARQAEPMTTSTIVEALGLNRASRHDRQFANELLRKVRDSGAIVNGRGRQGRDVTWQIGKKPRCDHRLRTARQIAKEFGVALKTINGWAQDRRLAARGKVSTPGARGRSNVYRIDDVLSCIMKNLNPSDMPPPAGYVTRQVACELLAISTLTFTKIMRTGKLEVKKIRYCPTKSVYFVSRDSISEYRAKLAAGTKTLMAVKGGWHEDQDEDTETARNNIMSWKESWALAESVWPKRSKSMREALDSNRSDG